MTNHQQNIQGFHQVIFLGLTKHLQKGKLPYPVGPISIIELTHYIEPLFFPFGTKGYKWAFLVDKNLLLTTGSNVLNLKVKSDTDEEVIKFNIRSEATVELSSVPEEEIQGGFIISDEIKWVLVDFNVDSVILRPGKYTIRALIRGSEEIIDTVHFIYQKVAPFTSEQIKAIESDPLSVKTVTVVLGCKYCPTKLNVYSALKRKAKLENDGYLWQHDLGNSFVCSCERTTINLEYIRENLHAVLGKDQLSISDDIGFMPRYRHSEILKLVEDFNKLVNTKKDEKVFQKFIENHTVMLARFQARKIFTKPKILGKFLADFAVLDTQNRLILIELERPNLRLFKKNGHPTSELMHAFGQVRDWIHEYTKHRDAVLEGLKLKSSEVLSVKGVVIAGRSKEQNQEHMYRHLSDPLYGDVDFLTLDDLAESLIQISRDLAKKEI